MMSGGFIALCGFAIFGCIVVGVIYLNAKNENKHLNKIVKKDYTETFKFSPFDGVCPCPSCCGLDEISVDEKIDVHVGSTAAGPYAHIDNNYRIRCHKCGIMTEECDTIMEVVNIWNNMFYGSEDQIEGE